MAKKLRPIPKVLIDDLLRQAKHAKEAAKPVRQLDLFADFNGLTDHSSKTEFYQHDQNWSNRMILGDSLQVMASLAEREGLRGKVQCIYFDPPYGIKFNSNFQWSTTSRDVKDGKADHITREPEQVKAFRDTWRDGIHSYLTYLRDRLVVARDLLTDSGSIFVQIGDENVHRVRAVMDEVFGDENHCTTIVFVKTTSQTSEMLPPVYDSLVWYAKSKESAKYRALTRPKPLVEMVATTYKKVELNDGIIRNMTADEIEKPESLTASGKIMCFGDMVSQSGSQSTTQPFDWRGQVFRPRSGGWKTSSTGLNILAKADRLGASSATLLYKRYFYDYPFIAMDNLWQDTQLGGFLRNEQKVYVVQTGIEVVKRCLLMVTDPGDLVLDPTCGSGTTAAVAEQWGRRWITIDTSRVALALARARIMGARYPYYLLADSRDGQTKEAEVTQSIPSSAPTNSNIRHGFVYQRVPHITLKSIANNSEIDIIWDKFKENLEPVREKLNQSLKQKWEEWEIPREPDDKWTEEAKQLHSKWWKLRIGRQEEIDASIAAKAEFEFLYDKPYEDKSKVRVAGPFTVESLSPHRAMNVGVDDELIDPMEMRSEAAIGNDGQSFVQMILDNLRSAGVQQAHKEDKINFSSITPWPGYSICAEGRYAETSDGKSREKRAGIFIGPEFGTVSKPDLTAAAREAGDAGFDVLISCAFNYDAHSTEFSKLGRLQVLKARMNADLHMADDLKKTDKANLFVIFGEPDIDLIETKDHQVQVKINGVDVFHPNTGEVRSDGADGIACWFIDTDYNEESFFVRHAYFLGANDPYKSLKTTLKSEIDEEAWSSLNSDTSRPFDKPSSGRIAVKVINHLGDEVMKVFRV